MATTEDNLLINLRIIAQVEPHAKINAKETLLSIESPGWIPLSISRYWRSDNRTVMLRRLVEIIDECKRQCNTCRSTGDKLRLRRFLVHLHGTLRGLSNLLQTYADDEQSTAHLGLLIEYVREVLGSFKFKPPKPHVRTIVVNELPDSSDTDSDSSLD